MESLFQTTFMWVEQCDFDPNDTTKKKYVVLPQMTDPSKKKNQNWKKKNRKRKKTEQNRKTKKSW